MKLRPASPRNEILATLGRFRPALRSVALFTAVINLLMLAPSLYMLQVYDRVLGSGNHMTLLMLTLMVLGLYLLLGALEWVRSLVVIRLGGQLDMQLNQRIYDASFRASLERGEQAVGQALNDLTSLRQFLTGNALFAFFDAPWFPLYLLVIFLFSPWLGLLALVGALLLVLLAWVNESRSREPLAEAGQLSILATQQASANLRQAETLAAMGMLPAMRARWFAQHQAFLAWQNLGSERSAAIGATSKGVRLALQSLVLGLGAWLAVEGLITPGMMIAGSILMGRVLSPIDQLIAVWRQWSGARQAYQRLARLLEENPPAALGMELDEKRFSRLGWGLVLLGFVGFLLWAGLAPLDKGVGVSGTVMVAGSRKAVQHPTGGLVRHIRVHEGERVEAGQVLLEMDATQARAQADGLFAQYLAALASLARLSAERDEKARIEFPAELLALDDPRLPTLLEQQRQLHDSRRRALRLELDGLAETVAGSQAQLDGLQAALRSKEQQRAALEEQLRGLRQLASEGYVPRNRLLDSERLLAQVNGEIAGDLGSLGSTRRQILELRLRMAQRREKFQEEVRGSLADAQVRAEELRNRLASARFDLANSEVRAPVAGLVVGQEVFTEGGVIAPGQQLMEILPERQPLLVDARLPVEMVDKVRVGLPVELMFSAFSQSTTPRVEGEVTLVSADRLLDERSEAPYYRVRIRVGEEGVRRLAGLEIRPGMPVEAFVRSGERSLLNYLFKPLADRTHLALGEE